MELTYDELIPNAYYIVKFNEHVSTHLFLGISDDNYAIFDGTNDSKIHMNLICHKFYNINPMTLITPIKTLIIEPGEYDPITFDSIEDGDIIILINNDKRFMFKEDTFKNHILSKNPYTNEKINQQDIIKYIAVTMQNIF